MEIRKLKILILLFFLLSCPVYADGGIPLWIVTAPSALSASLIPLPYLDGMWPFFIFLTLIFLVVVILVEFSVIKLFFLRNIAFIRLLKLVGIANILSTVAGAVITLLPAPLWYLSGQLSSDSKMVLALFGYWGFLPPISLLFINIFLLWLSYLIEYKYAKKELVQDYDKKLIKKSFLCANIVSYFIPVLLYSIATISVIGFLITNK